MEAAGGVTAAEQGAGNGTSEGTEPVIDADKMGVDNQSLTFKPFVELGVFAGNQLAKRLECSESRPGPKA